MRIRLSYYFKAFLLFVFLFFTTLVWTPELYAQDVQAIDKYLSIRTEMGRFSGAVLIAKGDKIILRKGYGFADVEKRTPYTPETQHQVASISKMFTAMAALKLRSYGKLRFDISICNYISDCPETWKPITVSHLIHHTSGIPDYEEALELGSEKYLQFMAAPDASTKIFENAKKQALEFKPGEEFHYSNTAYVVLSFIIQKVSGKPFEDFVTKNILQPAGMKNSGVFNTRSSPKKLASGYTYGDIGWEKTLAGIPLTAGHLKKIPLLPLNAPEGDAGIYSTVDDLYLWSKAMDGGKIVSADEVKEVFTPEKENYGFGWFIDNGFERKRARHNGMLPGYVSDFIKFPDDKITIIIFSNIDRAPLSRIARDVTAIVLGKPYDMPVRGQVVSLSQEEFAKLEGEYKTPDGRQLIIRKDPDMLVAELKGAYTAGLIPLSRTEFYMPLGDGRAIFTISADGKAVKVNMRYSGEDHLAERVK